MFINDTVDGMHPEKLLVERFKITTGFHEGQKEIISKLIKGERVLTIQRTGWGKSLCYQLASLYYPHLTIVFSPLKALMRDQAYHCNHDYSIPAAIVSSDFDIEENRQTLDDAINDKIKILFVSPERLNNLDWQAYVQQMNINMIVIDEAHCISIWGHDFRPDYQRIVHVLDSLPGKIPVLALTATANRRVEHDIMQQMRTAQTIRGSMQRPNLQLHVEHILGDQDKLEYLSALLPTLPGSGIIYTATRNNAEMVAAFLRAQNIDAIHYHAGIEDSMRQEIEQLWMANTYKVICSTNALGMGIHKPDIAFVIHYQLPASPINYYQEIGRAGRDGSAARCILLYDPEDKTIQEHFIQQAKPDQQHYSAVIDALRCEPMGMGRNDILRLTGLSQTTLKKILSDLEEQGFVKHFIHRKVRKYAYIFTLRQPDLSNNEQLRSQKEQELQDIINYANNNTCLMRYLTTYLGDHEENDCHVCSKCNAQSSPPIAIHASIRQSVALFLREGFLPHIEKRGSEKKPIHEAGWSLSYHGSSPLGKQVRASKYEGAGDFSAELVAQAVKILRVHYPLEKVSGIVSIPSTTSGSLVETFARSIANTLQIEYIPALKKTRRTSQQKNFSNWIQKAANIEGAFAISNPGRINKRTLLCIDDIYDSGYTMREAGQTLMQAGALAVYPFTITRTQHSDDQ